MGNARERSSAERSERTKRDARERLPSAPEGRTLASRGLALEQVGNRALLSLLRSGQLQRTARISQPGDPLEHAADRAADAVVAGARPERARHVGAAAPDVQLMPTQDEKLAMALGLGPRTADAMPTSPPAETSETPAADVIGHLYGGRSLDEQTRELMELRFGETFSEVRRRLPEGTLGAVHHRRGHHQYPGSGPVSRAA